MEILADGFIKISSALGGRRKLPLGPSFWPGMGSMHDPPSPGVGVLSMDGREALEGSTGHSQHCHGSVLFSLRSKHKRCIDADSQ